MNQQKDISRMRRSPARLLMCLEIVGVRESKRRRKKKNKERRKIERMNYLFFRNCDVQLY
jgi:hypothetical protein